MFGRAQVQKHRDDACKAYTEIGGEQKENIKRAGNGLETANGDGANARIVNLADHPRVRYNRRYVLRISIR